MLETQELKLAESFADALETMAFVSVLPPEGPAGPPPEPKLISIEFAGPCYGTVELVASEALGAKLAANMLGGEGGDALGASRAEDALKELLNVTCGLLLPRLDRHSAERFEMTVPQLRDLNAELEWPRFVADPAAQVLDAEGEVIAIRVRIK